MTAAYSDQSKRNLATCDERLQRIFNVVIQVMDHSITEGHRGQELQEQYFKEGKTQKHWPDGNHNKIPSNALDAVVYPVPPEWGKSPLTFDSICRFHIFAGIVKGVAAGMGYKVRWGGDWNMNNRSSDEHFKDYPHFEVID